MKNGSTTQPRLTRIALAAMLIAVPSVPFAQIARDEPDPDKMDTTGKLGGRKREDVSNPEELEDPMNPEDYIARIAKRYKVTEEQVRELRGIHGGDVDGDEGTGLSRRETRIALALAKRYGEKEERIMRDALRLVLQRRAGGETWEGIAESLDTTIEELLVDKDVR